MYHISHLHTDSKFISSSSIFANEVFLNTVFFISNNQCQNPFSDNVVVVRVFLKEEFDNLIAILNKSDLIVTWGLSPELVRIVNLVSGDIPVVWRFFGVELYSKMSKEIYSQSTIKAKEKTYKRLIKAFPGMDILSKMINKEKDFIRAVKRANFFMGLCITEYKFLKLKFPLIPQFINVPYRSVKESFSFNKPQPLKIIIGHSAHALNNHLDILSLVANTQVDKCVSYYMFLSYGQDSTYISEVKRLALKITNMNLIESMLPLQEFNSFYQNSHAFVLNSYRQAGMGNVFVSLRSGVKVYLNTINLMYHWLREEGFLVFSIDELKSDLTTNNLVLSEMDAEYNYKCYIRLTQRYPIESFQQIILSILKDNPI